MILLTVPGKLVNFSPEFTEARTTDFYLKHQKQPPKVFHKKTFFNWSIVFLIWLWLNSTHNSLFLLLVNIMKKQIRVPTYTFQLFHVQSKVTIMLRELKILVSGIVWDLKNDLCWKSVSCTSWWCYVELNLHCPSKFSLLESGGSNERLLRV